MRPLAVGETQLVIADVEGISLIDTLVVDSHALVVDAVGGAEILDVEGSVTANHCSMLARDIAIFDRKIGCLRSSTNNELVLGDRISLIVENEKECAAANGP